VLTILGALLGWSFAGVALALAILFAFFVPSVALSRVGAARKRGGPRNAAQVMANGGIATLCAVAAGLIARGAEAPAICSALLWAYAGAYAAATADTWATEIGSAFGGTPRSIVTLQPVQPGLSGGITALGTAATAAGALWIALVCALALRSWTALVAVTLAGIAGSLVDSLAGATVQSLRACPACGVATEDAIHSCGTPADRVRGARLVTNDTVNALCTLAGALTGGVAYYALAFVSRP